MKKNRVLKLPL